MEQTVTGDAPCRGHSNDTSETNALMAASELRIPSGYYADDRLEPPPARGRCVTAAVVLAATTACAGLVLHWGQVEGAVSGVLPQDATVASWKSTVLADLHKVEATVGNLLQQRKSFSVAPTFGFEDRNLILGGDNLFDDVAQDIVQWHKLPGLWRVPSGSWPDVLSSPNAAATPLDSLEQCQIVSGTVQNFSSDGNQWIRLIGGRGNQDRWVSLDNWALERAFMTSSEPGQACDEGFFPLASSNHCHMAALDMGLNDTRVSFTTLETMPEGCFVFNGSTAIMNTNPLSKGNVGSELLQLICSNLVPCVPETSSTVTVTSTSITDTPWTTTSSTLIFDHPSLFCFVLAEANSYEGDLLRYARSRRTSLYGCEEHLTLTDSAVDVGTADDPEITIAIGSLKCEKGSWGSWANAEVFMKGWKAVITDGRFRKHDWIVKLDADTVFHPDRLKYHVQDMETEYNKVFMENYLDGYPVVGAIEVASKAAILAFESRIDECERIAYGAEDDWFVKCMRLLGAWMRKDDMLLQHEQHPVGNMCYNKNFVAMHPYKLKDSYGQCLDQGASRQAQFKDVPAEDFKIRADDSRTLVDGTRHGHRGTRPLKDGWKSVEYGTRRGHSGTRPLKDGHESPILVPRR